MTNIKRPLSDNPNINGVLWDGWAWDTASVAYSFPDVESQYPTEADNFDTLNALQREAARLAFREVAAFTNLSFFEGTATNTIYMAGATKVDTNGDGVTDDDIGTASGRAPSDDNETRGIDGDIWFHPTDYDNPLVGSYQFAAGVIHEIGHALGLKHPHDVIGGAGLLSATFDAIAYTVMSYRDYPGDALDGAGSGNSHPQSFMMLDIAALQHLYGADFSRTTNDVYRFTPTLGPAGTNFFVNGAPHEPDVDLAANIVFRTIWDAGGFDTYDFSAYALTNLSVDLRPGAWTSLGVQLAQLEDDQDPPGNIANALLFQGDLRSLIEAAIGGSGHDTLTGNQGDNTLTGNAGNDVLLGLEGNDRFEGGAGADEMQGGLGIDQAQYSDAPSAVVADLVFFVVNGGQAAGDTYDGVENLRGSLFDDILRGDDGPNGLGGWNGGNDTLIGRGGNDSLNGGVGDDLLDGGAGGDALDGGDGVDEAAYGGAPSRVVVDLLASQAATLVGDAFGDTFIGIENVSGSGFNDDLRGDGVANVLWGGSGSDGLMGRGGLDRLIGGPGDDLFFLEDLGFSSLTGFAYDFVVEALGEGADTAIVFAQDNPDTFSSVETYTLGDNIEHGQIRNAIAFNMTGNALANSITGNSAVNTLRGFDGNDTLNGFTGLDSLIGGSGDDTYVLDDLDRQSEVFAFTYDAVTEGVDAGIDTVFVMAIDNPDTFGSDAYTLGANVEHGVITGTITHSLNGNALDNQLTGNSGVNGISGAAGNDTLAGAGGLDTLSGGAGDDTYILADVNAPSQFAVFAYDTVVESAGGGTDTVLVTALDLPDSFSDFYTLGAQVENGVIVGAGGFIFHLYGNALNNALTGNAAINELRGFDGDDMLNGGGGDDTIEGGAGDDGLVGGDGVDLLTYASAAAGVTVLLYRLAPQNTGGSGVDTLAGFENVTGSAFNDSLVGDASANILTGGAGVDTLDGAAGNDRMFGGAGNDGMRGSAGADHYDGGDGVDLVNFGVSGGVNVFLDGSGTNGAGAVGDTFTNVENLIGGIGNDFLVGNASDNRFTGGTGNDRLWGRGGVDQLEGGDGSDRLWGGPGNDILVGGLVGGTETDTFVFTDSPATGGFDRTADFLTGIDIIEIDASMFGGGLVAGGAVQLVANATPSSSGVVGGVFLYDTDTGFLSWDADGEGAGAAALFFRLQNLPALDAGDFLVVA